MNSVNNLLDTLHSAHRDNAQNAYYAKRHGRGPHSTMPATSFVFEFFLYNSIYQYDWSRTFEVDRLVPWVKEDKLLEWKKQVKLEKFMRDRCRSDASILKRAFDPISHLEDLSGDWTTITPDARITPEDGERFFADLSKLRDLLRSDDGPSATRAVFNLIGNCRHFVYLVRNSVFHGSKSIGEIYERDQKRRIEVYDLFLKSLVSMFFLTVDRSPVAADHVQLPVQINCQNNHLLSIGQSEIVDLVVSGWMKPEDSRLILRVAPNQPAPGKPPGARDSLFSPSAGKDVITPILLGLPHCAQFFFYDHRASKHARPLRTQLGNLLETAVEVTESDFDQVLRFEFLGVPRAIHLVRNENRKFLDRDVDLTFYFHRGDSLGEGGSGQEWDSSLFAELTQKTPDGRQLRIVTDGEPGGLRDDIRSRMQIASIPTSHRGQDYYFGFVPGSLAGEIDRMEPEPGVDAERQHPSS